MEVEKQAPPKQTRKIRGTIAQSRKPLRGLWPFLPREKALTTLSKEVHAWVKVRENAKKVTLEVQTRKKRRVTIYLTSPPIDQT